MMTNLFDIWKKVLYIYLSHSKIRNQISIKNLSLAVKMLIQHCEALIISPFPAVAFDRSPFQIQDKEYHIAYQRCGHFRDICRIIVEHDKGQHLIDVGCQFKNDHLLNMICSHGQSSKSQYNLRQLAMACFRYGIRNQFDRASDAIIELHLEKDILDQAYYWNYKHTPIGRLLTSMIEIEITGFKGKIASISGIVCSILNRIIKADSRMISKIYSGRSVVTFASSFPGTESILRKLFRIGNTRGIDNTCLFQAARYSSLDTFKYLFKRFRNLQTITQTVNSLVRIDESLSGTRSTIEVSLNIFNAALCCNRSPSIAKYLVELMTTDKIFSQAKSILLSRQSLETIYNIFQHTSTCSIRSIRQRLELLNQVLNVQSGISLLNMLCHDEPYSTTDDNIYFTSCEITKLNPLAMHTLEAYEGTFTALQAGQFLSFASANRNKDAIVHVMNRLSEVENGWNVLTCLVFEDTCINTWLESEIVKYLFVHNDLRNQDPNIIEMVIGACFNITSYGCYEYDETDQVCTTTIKSKNWEEYVPMFLNYLHDLIDLPINDPNLRSTLIKYGISLSINGDSNVTYDVETNLAKCHQEIQTDIKYYPAGTLMKNGGIKYQRAKESYESMCLAHL